MHVAPPVRRVVGIVRHIAVIENRGRSVHPAGKSETDDGGEGQQTQYEFDQGGT